MGIIIDILVVLISIISEQIFMHDGKKSPVNYGNLKTSWQRAWEENGRRGNPYSYINSSNGSYRYSENGSTYTTRPPKS